MLNVNFEPPESGWMTVQLDEFSFNVSDVPCDSLRGLISVISRILSGSMKEEVVQWSLEPDYATWIFQRIDDNSISLSITTDSKTKPIHLLTDSTSIIVDPILSALNNLGEHEIWANDSDLRIWSWDFPYKQLQRLKNHPKRVV